MRTVQLSPNLPAADTSSTPQSQQAALAGEISERLVEWSLLPGGEGKARGWVSRLALLFADRDCPQAGWLYLRMQCGDSLDRGLSFAEIGAGKCRSKQAVQQELERALAVIAKYFPAAAAEIVKQKNANQQTYVV